MNPVSIKIRAHSTDGDEYDLEFEGYDLGDGKTVIVYPSYMAPPINEGKAVSMCPRAEFEEDVKDMSTASSTGSGFLAVEKHIQRHSRIFEQDIDAPLDTIIHFYVVAIDAQGKYTDNTVNEWIAIAQDLKKQMIAQAGKHFISYEDPRYKEHVSRQR